MTPERWREVKKILDEVEEQPAGGRRAFVREASRGDAALEQEVLSLLEYEDDLADFIEEPILAKCARAIDQEGQMLGERIGPYRLLRLLGQGGMGAVYLGSREEGFEQRVALKVLHPGSMRPEWIRRFEAERQILARLEHPNIARLLGGGTSEGGLPYFAMEVVDGQPIDRYCEEKGLSVRERLQLFLPVGAALSFAHQNLVVHRDLKPGNILVDAAGVPKLLDFGIAKLLADAKSSAAPTERIFTLHYASPEQLKGEPIGTATDVYSLGVVIYEALTGELPSHLADRNHLEMMRVICEETPPLASQAVAKGASQHSERARATLGRQLAGDVDAILAKALRKEPAQRYPSIETMMADIRQHLEHRPVLARQGNFAYQAGRYLRRHRLALATAAGVVLLAASFTVALAYQLEETQAARDRAEKVSDFVVDIFQSAAPDVPTGKEKNLRQMLAVGRVKLATGLGNDPQAKATLMLKLGEVYFKLGEYGEAASLLDESIAIFRRQEGDAAEAELASALSARAAVWHSLEKREVSEALLNEAIAIRRRLGRDDDLLKPLSSLAALRFESGDLAGAEEIYREVLEKRRAAGKGLRYGNVATTLRSLAVVVAARGRPEEARDLLQEALAIRQEVFGADNERSAHVLLSLGQVEAQLGRRAEARILTERALAIFRATLGEDHPDYQAAQRQLEKIGQALPEDR